MIDFSGGMEAWIVEGVMPERVINRLQKAGITLFRAKKIKKMQILFHISKKDIEKAFAIYPNMCYNNIRGSVYTFTRVGALPMRTRIIRTHKILGILLGVVAWFLLVFLSSFFVFRIEVVGSTVYDREVRALLREHGISVFSVYPENKEEMISSKLLSFPEVEFCSVQKRGNTVRVEIRQSAWPITCNEQGDLISPLSGILQDAVILSGTLLKKAGEEVAVGEPVVGGYFIHDDKRTDIRVVAKLRLLCVESVVAKTEELAYAKALLLVESLGGEWKSIVYEQVGNEIQARVEFTLVIKKNM